MLTDDDKKWIADQIAASEKRLTTRMKRIEGAFITEFLETGLDHIDAGGHFSRDEMNER